MGLLDKAKEKQQEGQVPAPDATAEPQPADTGTAAPAVKKKTVKKKTADPDARPSKGSGTGSTVKKKTGTKPSGKKKAAPSKGFSRPARQKVKAEPEKPDIEGLPENLEFASISHRAVATVIDWLLLLVVCSIIFLAAFIAVDEAGLIVGMIAFFIIPPVYFIFYEGTTGQTIGKNWMHVRIISLDGKPLSPKRYLKAGLWKGVVLPIVGPLISIIDAAVGVFFSHKDTRQRISQYNEDLIVVSVQKKKLKYGSFDQTGESSEPAEADETHEASWDSDQPAPADEGGEPAPEPTPDSSG